MTWHWMIQKLINDEKPFKDSTYEHLREMNKWLEHLSSLKEIFNELQYFQYYGSENYD